MQQRLRDFIIHRPQVMYFFSRVRLAPQERMWFLVRVIYKCLRLNVAYRYRSV